MKLNQLTSPEPSSKPSGKSTFSTKPSKSGQYVTWINIATFLAIVALCFLFYTAITKYLSWKMTELKKEQFLERIGALSGASEVDENVDRQTSNIGIVSMMKEPKDIKTWLKTHRDLGIRHFYIRLEETPDLELFLKSQPDVTVRSGESNGVNEYDEQQKRQDEWVNEAFQMAALDNPQVKWLIHIDSDELLQGDLDQIEALPDDVRTFWMQNLEAKYSKIPTESDNCFTASTFIDCSKYPDKCVSYGNGKSGGRVAPDVSANGPHRMKTIITGSSMPKLSGLFVQHHESCDFATYKKKFKRLAVQDRKLDIPFPYYNESIAAARRDDDNELRNIYRKYRVFG